MLLVLIIEFCFQINFVLRNNFDIFIRSDLLQLSPYSCVGTDRAPLVDVMEEMNITNFVIVRSDPTDHVGRPFWVAQVKDKYAADHPLYGSIKVVWYVPRAGSRTPYGHGAFYEETITRKDERNQRTGRRTVANADVIECSTIHFCFTALNKSNLLPKPVKDKIDADPSIDWTLNLQSRASRQAKRTMQQHQQSSSTNSKSRSRRR